MSYTKLFGESKMTIYKGTDCDNCKCTNENLILSFGKYGKPIKLCKKCINIFMEYNFKPNKECYECQDYFEEVIETKTKSFFGENLVSVNMCKECNEMYGFSEEDAVKYEKQQVYYENQKYKMEVYAKEREEFELDADQNF